MNTITNRDVWIRILTFRMSRALTIYCGLFWMILSAHYSYGEPFLNYVSVLCTWLLSYWMNYLLLYFMYVIYTWHSCLWSQAARFVCWSPRAKLRGADDNYYQNGPLHVYWTSNHWNGRALKSCALNTCYVRQLGPNQVITALANINPDSVNLQNSVVSIQLQFYQYCY